MYTLRENLGYSKKRILSLIVIIALISVGLKLYTIDFSTLPSEDTFGYVLRAISHNNGDFTEPTRKTLGWSIAISPFFKFIDSNNFLDYVGVVKVLSLSISLISIYPMYLLARRFFNEKYSVVAAFLFAIEPHLNYNAGLGLSEPLFILISILAVYFVLSKNTKFVYLSFFLTGLLWWIRFNGIVMFPIILLIFFLNFKRSRSLLLKFFLGLTIFLIVVSPMLIHKYEQYGDPLYFSQSSTLYTGEYATIVAENTKSLNYSSFDYVNEHGLPQFIGKFVIGGMYNLLDQTFKLSFPYLMILLPFGILFSFRAFDQDSKHVRANWIVILITLGSFVTYFAVVQDRRLIYHILPFLIIFSVIPIQRLVEYGLSTFSFSKHRKNLFLLLILGIILLLAVSFTLRYELPDKVEGQEKIELARYLYNHYDGKILDAGNTLQGLLYVKITDPPGSFKQYQIKNDVNPSTINDKLTTINLYDKSMNDFISTAEKYDLQYIAINKKGVTITWYPFLENVYDNDAHYPYLKKIVDSNQLGFKKLEVKVFEIDYEKFHEQITN